MFTNPLIVFQAYCICIIYISISTPCRLLAFIVHKTAKYRVTILQNILQQGHVMLSRNSGTSKQNRRQANTRQILHISKTYLFNVLSVGSCLPCSASNNLFPNAENTQFTENRIADRFAELTDAKRAPTFENTHIHKCIVYVISVLSKIRLLRSVLGQYCREV